MLNKKVDDKKINNNINLDNSNATKKKNDSKLVEENNKKFQMAREQ